MGSSDRLFKRHTTIHDFLGGGLVADVVLWRRKNLTLKILVLSLSVWFLFEIFGYTLLSYSSNVLLLLFTILFLWSKSAAILNRPAPSLPHFHLSQEMANEVATFVRDRVNTLLNVSEDIALGRDTRMFVKVALSLLTLSVIGSLTNLLTLCCASVILVLTIPVLYETYENHIDTNALWGCRKIEQLYFRFNEECIIKTHRWILEKKKLC